MMKSIFGTMAIALIFCSCGGNPSTSQEKADTLSAPVEKTAVDTSIKESVKKDTLNRNESEMQDMKDIIKNAN